MEAHLSAMEKTIETSELLEIVVETEAEEAGVSGMSVTGGGRGGLFVKDVLKDSPAARALSLREGDQLLSARVYFDNIKYEDALQILKCAEPYKISFWLKRTVPSTDVSRKPGASTFEVRGPKAKMAKLNIQSLTSLKKRKKVATKKQVAKGLAEDLREAQRSGDLAAGKLEMLPVDVEFSLPKFAKLRKAKSVGEVHVAEPSPAVSPHPSSLETKRRKLKFPRLKVKEAAAAAAGRAERVEGRLEVGLPKVTVDMKAAGKGGPEEKGFRFPVPFSKAKGGKERAEGKGEAGFQAPQVELDLPLPKVSPGAEHPKVSTKGEGFRIQAPHLGLPKVETVLPRASTVGQELPETGLQVEMKLPVAEVAAPKVDVDLGFPKMEGAAPDIAPKGEGFKIKVPKFGVSTEETELRLPTLTVLGQGRGKAEGPMEKQKLGVTVPSLEVGVPSVDLEVPLTKGKVEVEVSDVSVKMPSVRLPKLSTKPPEEAAGKLPQVEISAGKLGSPQTKAKGPRIQMPALGLSLVERMLETKDGAVESKVRFPEVKMPSLDISAPKVGDVQLPKPMVELAGPAGRVKAEEAAEAPRFKFQMPEVSLPKFDLPARASYSPPQIHAKWLQQEEAAGGVKVGVPKVDLSLPAAKLPEVQLSKVPVPKPELDISVEKPKLEVAVPAVDIDLPRVGVELDLPKTESECLVLEQPFSSREVKPRVPTLEMMSRGLEVEISVPKCQLDQPEAEPTVRTFEGPVLSGVAAQIPKVDLALGKELPAAEGDLKGKPLPKIGLELEGARMKLPSVEIPSVKLPDVTTESSRSPEAETRVKSPRFTLPKFSISGPKAWKSSPEAPTAEVDSPEAADKGSKLKMPKFGISFPKSKWGAEVEGPKIALDIEGKAPKEKAAAALEPRVGLDYPELSVPAVDVEMPIVDVDLGLPKWSSEEAAAPSPQVGIELPDVKLKVPKFSLPKFGDKDKESDLKIGKDKLRGSGEALAGVLGAKMPEKEAKVPKFKMPSFSLIRKDAQATGREVGIKAKKAPGSPKEKPKGHFAKMPKLRLSPPVAEAEKGKVLHLQAPGLEVKVPQVELPKIGATEAREEAGPIVSPESPSLKVKMPALEIAGLGPRAPRGEPVLDVSEADLRGYERELKIPTVPSIDISAPKVELDVHLPTASAEGYGLHGATSPDAKIKLPQVELPKFGRGEESGVEVQLLGGERLSLEREGEEDTEGAAEGFILGAKIRVPKVDLSLPKGSRLSDVELPLTEGAAAVEGPEGKFKLPSVGLPKFSTSKVKAPEVELDVGLEAGKVPRIKAGGPALRLPRFGGSSPEGEGEAEVDLPRVPQLELKAPKLRGSTEMLGPESGAKEAKIKMPSLPIGFGISKGETDSRTGADEGKFKLRLPSLSLSKAGAESSTDTQPLCPPGDAGADFSFRMPQIALPDVGFSLDPDGKREARGEAGRLGDLDVDVGGLEGRPKMPQIRIGELEIAGLKGDTEGTLATSQGHRWASGSGGGGEEGGKMAFAVPGLDISSPSLKAHAAYEVEGAQLRHGGSQELEGSGRRSPVGKGGATTTDAGKKYKVKIPKFGLSLPKSGPEAGDGVPGQEAEGKAKRSVFVLGGRPKGKEAEGSSGLLEGEEAGAEGSKGVMAKLKVKPTFGLSLAKPKAGAEVNGELEEGAAKLRMPKLGFSKAEGEAQVNGEKAEASLANGAQDSKSPLGKVRLPQVELSSPSKVAEMDPELNLQLMRAEEAKEEAQGQEGPSTTSTFAALKAAKFKSPKISFSGFKKRNGEGASGAVVSSAARTEMASLEMGGAGAKGEKSPKFKFPKLVLSPKSQGVLKIASEHQDGRTGEDEGGRKIKLPSVGFSEELSSGGQILEGGGGPTRAEGASV